MTRRKGKSLPETGYEFRKVVIYRAAVTPVNTFKSMDYVTRSRKFATDHAEHIAVVEEEDANVLKALVDSSDVYEAYNPGEYFYDGPEITGKIIKVVPAFKPNPAQCESSPTLRHQWEKRRHLIAIRGTFCKHCLIPYSVWEKMLRSNPDERLRELERQYKSSPTEGLRSRLNVLRLRAGFKLMPPICRVYEYGEGWQVQSTHGEITISTATVSHDGWMGIDHAWFTERMEYPSSLGSHIFSRGYGQELPKPSRQQVIQAHLEVTSIFDRGEGTIGGMNHFLVNRPAFPDGHQCDFSIYDLSESPLQNPARRPWLTGDLHRRIGALLELYRNQIAATPFVERLEMPDEYEMLASKLGCLRATVTDWYSRGGGFVHSPSKRYTAAINTLYEEEFL